MERRPSSTLGPSRDPRKSREVGRQVAQSPPPRLTGKGPVGVHQGDSELVAIETRARKGAPPRPPPSAGSSKPAKIPPSGGRSRTYSGSRSMQIDTSVLRCVQDKGGGVQSAPRICGAARTGRTPSHRGRSRTYVSSRSMQIDTWFLHSALFLLTPKFAGGKLAALGPAAARTSFPPGCHSGRGGSRRKPPRPLRSLGCQSVGLRQGDRGSPGVRADPLAKPFLGTRNP
jgi:hypothetical protein